MIAQGHSPRADPVLVEAWLRARSVARGIAPPVPDSGGWRVETGTSTETRRHVFARPGKGLRELAETIVMPKVALKLCGSAAELRSMVPPRWEVQPETCMMTRAAPPGGGPPLRPGYALRLSTEGAATAARIVTSDGEVAASGFAAETGGVFAYDRIRTEPTHRRKGLGTALMQALASARRSSASIEILTATRDGQALYSTLGWTVHCPYTTALIPEGGA